MMDGLDSRPFTFRGLIAFAAPVAFPKAESRSAARFARAAWC
jgi:hypothetical protein